MAKSYEVLEMLIPDGGYVQSGDSFEGIDFINCEPITKKQYQDAFAKFDALKAKQATDLSKAKTALLEKLGITEDEAKLLLS
jgi:hypothetical protein